MPCTSDTPDSPRSAGEVETAPLVELTATQLYGILRLRTDVFVVEQHCPYPELDGRDLEPTARQLWVADEDAVIACARLLTEADGTRRIGRVATRADRRGQGLAGQLLITAIELSAGAEMVLSAQAHLTGFYGRYGFRVDGDEYLEDGIRHRPMRRPAA